MKNLVVVGSNAKSWAIGIEIANSLVQNGKTVHLLDVSNFDSRRPISYNRRKFQKVFCKKLDISVQKLPFRYGFSLKLFKNSRIPDSMYELENYEIFGTPFGGIIKSYLSALYGSNDFSMESIEKSDFHKLIRLLKYFFLAFQKYLENSINEFDCVYVFNGRLPIDSTILMEFKRKGKSTRIYERASSSNRYEIYDYSPHTNSEWWDKIEDFQKKVNSRDLLIDIEEVNAYKKQKSSGFDPLQKVKWRNFMDSNLSSIEIQKPYVVFYSVSTGEVSPFREFESVGGFSNQFIALDCLLEQSKSLGLTTVVRRHPNSLGKDGEDREFLLWDKYRNNDDIKYFGPKSRIDSYGVALNAIACFTWRSTIGFDTLCLRIPSYSLGPSKWAFDPSVRAWDANSILLALKKPTLAKEEIVLTYASYMSHFGTRCKIFKEIERWGFTTINNVRFYNLFLQRTFEKIKNLMPNLSN